MTTKIRPYRPEDIRPSVRILADAFSAKFLPLVRVPAEDLPDLLLKAGAIPADQYTGFLVAEEDGVVGVMALKMPGVKRPKAKADTRGALHYGLWRLFKLWLGMSAMEHNPKADECYIEFIAVSDGARGKGVGKLLLEEGRKLATSRGLKRYTLFVAKPNEGAIRLYQRTGFKPVREVKSRLTKMIFGIRNWVFMEMEL